MQQTKITLLLKRIVLLSLLAVIAANIASSCMSVALWSIGAYKEWVAVTVFKNDSKTVAFIPMVHVGKHEFYTDVKHKVDSLQKDGYIVFMESVAIREKLGEAQTDTIHRKLRKLMGVTVGKQGYLDTINKTIMGRKFNNKSGLTNQPRYYKLGVDTLSAKITDVPMNVLIAEYERLHGTIVLEECDFTTPLEKKYSCKRKKNNWMDDFALGYRNRHLAAEIVNESHTKIAVMFGSRHTFGLLQELQNIDSTWQWQRPVINKSR